MAHESKIARLRELVEQVGNTGMFDAGREDELGEITDLVRQLDAAGALEQRTAFVQVVDVVDRQDGTYVFEDVDDAKAFEAVVNAQSGVNLAHESACYRNEQVVCAHADALKLIAAECEASTEAEAASLESGTPVSNYAWKKGESAPYPEKLEAVEYTVYQRIHAADAEARKVVLWVGLNPDNGAVNVDAGRERLESEGWEVTDWGSA
jgi:hypothetical protein